MHPTLKNTIATIFLLMFTLSGFTQRDKSFLETTIEKLRQLQVDTVIYYVPFQGSASTINRGSYRTVYSSYLIWKTHGQFFITKLSLCLDSLRERSFDTIFKEIKLPNAELPDNIIQNLDLIKNEHLKQGLIKYYNGKKDTIIEKRSSHPLTTGISVYIGSIEIQNYFSDIQIYDGKVVNNDGTLRGTQNSINYLYNTSTYVYKVTNRLFKLIEELENANSFDH